MVTWLLMFSAAFVAQFCAVQAATWVYNRMTCTYCKRPIKFGWKAPAACQGCASMAKQFKDVFISEYQKKVEGMTAVGPQSKDAKPN